MRLRLSTAFTLVLGIGLLVTGSALGAFCDRPSRNPYLPPLEALPPVHQPPTDSGLPFASNVRVEAVNTPLVPKGSPLGFVISRRNPGSRSETNLQLEVEARISKVDKRGRVRHLLRRSNMRITAGKTVRSVYTPSDVNRFFRADLMFVKNGRKVRTYSQYFRSLAPTFDAGVALSGSSFLPGQTVYARLENLGVVPMSSGYGYRAERLNGSTWEADSQLQGDRSISKGLFVLGPGSIFDCRMFPIPTSQPAGRYRLVKNVGASGTSQRRIIAGEFDIG
jgi:hypothetical protein